MTRKELELEEMGSHRALGVGARTRGPGCHFAVRIWDRIGSPYVYASYPQMREDVREPRVGSLPVVWLALASVASHRGIPYPIVTFTVYLRVTYLQLHRYRIATYLSGKMDEGNFSWQRTVGSQTYLISTDRSFLPHSFVHEAFATEAMYWAKPLSSEALSTMLNNSLTLGLYLISNDTKTPIGMARMVTDYTTLAYLTDVYLLPQHQGQGLGKWIIACCRNICTMMEDLRFMVLLTGSEQAQELYRRELGMQKLDGGEQPLVCMGARRTKLAEAAAAAPSK
jgi:GNAT superfamily N-acetyltransferase